jgi:hypothetical protein
MFLPHAPARETAPHGYRLHLVILEPQVLLDQSDPDDPAHDPINLAYDHLVDCQRRWDEARPRDEDGCDVYDEDGSDVHDTRPTCPKDGHTRLH